MKTRFVSEAINPVAETMPPADMAKGAPGFPGRFIWRGKEYTLAEVLETWHETGPCTHGSAEQYVRKHWFRVRTTTGEKMKIYFERQPRSKRDAKRRWWLHSVGEGE